MLRRDHMYYHASPIKGITQLEPRISNHGIPLVYFSKKRENVLKLGIGLELELYDICRLMWCRGHSFPKEQVDYELIEFYIQEKDYEGALEVLYDEYGDPRDKLADKSQEIK